MRYFIPFLFFEWLALISKLANAVYHAGLKERQLLDPIAPSVPMVPPIMRPPANNKPPNQDKKPSSQGDTPKFPSHTGNRNCKPGENCQTTLDQTVFPKDCGKTQDNDQITSVLKKLAEDGNVDVSIDNDCGGRGSEGVFLWLVKLRLDHKQDVLKLPNVDGIEVNTPIDIGNSQLVGDSTLGDPIQVATSQNQNNDKPEDILNENSTNDGSDKISDSIAEAGTSISSSQDDALQSDPETSTISAQFRLQKRSSIFRQQYAPPHLVFISNPLSRAKAKKVDYLYPDDPDKRITIYSIDSGVNPRHEEFARPGIIKKWLYAAGVPQRERSPTDHNGHGTCALSVTSGQEFGVFKDPDVVVAKVMFTVGSQLAMFQAILNDLLERVKHPDSGPIQGPVKGYTVISLHSEVKYVGRLYISRLTKVIRTLIEVHNVVIVTSAGNSAPKEPLILGYPSVLAKKFPIIVTGAVDLSNGDASSFSQGGPLLTVSAPGAVQCAKRLSLAGYTIYAGTSFAAASTAGLVAILLADPTIGDLLRKSPLGVVAAVKACIVELAQQRGNVKSIWNGIDERKKNANYGWPPTNLACLRGTTASLDEDLDGEIS